jgi:hypothetical protein
MCGQEGLFGTNAFQLLLNMEMMRTFDAEMIPEPTDVDMEIEEMFQEKDVCSVANIGIENNIDHIKRVPTVMTNYVLDF